MTGHAILLGAFLLQHVFRTSEYLLIKLILVLGTCIYLLYINL
jgi:hypothetical protein